MSSVEQTKEMLEKQLQLLFERSQKISSSEEMVRISLAMCEIAQTLASL